MKESNITSKTPNTILILGVTTVILIAVAFMRIQGDIQYKAKGAEAKDNLHELQLATERYGVDRPNIDYPLYLIGGEFPQGITESSNRYVSDDLIRECYMPRYPKNPFVTGSRFEKKALKDVQTNLNTSVFGHDPMRPGHDQGDKHGYRFGQDYSRMGQVLCDARFEKFSVTLQDGSIETYNSGAIVEYRMWDFDLSEEEVRLPGQFFYKAFDGFADRIDDLNVDIEIERRNEQPTKKDKIIVPLKPTYAYDYMMGVYGSRRNKGQDILGQGTKRFSIFRALDESGNRYPNSDSCNLSYLWTHSTYDDTDLSGCPTLGWNDVSYEDSTGFDSNPNGIPDGLIMCIDSIFHTYGGPVLPPELCTKNRFHYEEEVHEFTGLESLLDLFEDSSDTATSADQDR